MRKPVVIQSLDNKAFGIVSLANYGENTRLIGIQLWETILGLEVKDRKPRLSEKKFMKSVKECQEAISRLNHTTFRNRQSEEN